MVLIAPAQPEDAPAIAAVHVAAWRAAYAGIVPQVVLDSLSEVQRTAQWRRILAAEAGWTLVARDGGRMAPVVGFVQGCALRDADAAPGDGEVGGLYLRPDRRGHGLGRALMAAAVKRLAAEGMAQLFVWVLADNRPARAFYAHLGGVPDRTQYDTIGGRRLREVRYRWDALPRL
ncbi:GNAT family N-acetyltransferase [Caenispirillum salinarum]|uniref:GNAT family N-acetyltransferase n=1 Tax=Caenispirillum salinarum TaxID=859058 RepID=UPI00384D1E15